MVLLLCGGLAIYASPHEATRLSPFELMYGRKPRLPIDFVFESANEDTESGRTTVEYIKELQDRLEQTRKLVQERTSESKAKQKKYYDQKAKTVQFKVGDRVLVRRKQFDGKHKIQDRFEEDIHLIVEQPRKEIPVFKVRSGDRERTLHRNLLFLVQDIGEDPGEDEEHEVEEVEDSDASMTDEEVIEEEFSSCSESEYGYEFADIAYQDGDAHLPQPVKNDDAQEHGIIDEGGEESESVSQNSSENTILIQDADSAAENNEDHNDDDEDDDTGEDTEIEVNSTDSEHEEEDDSIDDDNEDAQEDRDIHMTETHDSIVENEEVQQEKDVNIEEEDVIDEIQKPDTGAAAVHQSAEPESEGKDFEENRPVPTPRRTTRCRRPPERYQDYQMYAMTVRPIDSRIHTLHTLMDSGILNNVDSDMAHRMIAAIFK